MPRSFLYSGPFGSRKLPTMIANAGICQCSAFQVEMWLNKVLDTMRSTIRHELSEAVVSYEEKPRDQWLFDFPAQVSWSVYGFLASI